MNYIFEFQSRTLCEEIRSSGQRIQTTKLWHRNIEKYGIESFLK